MADLSQAFSEVKSLPDHILQKEISSPSGSIPGWLALGEIHERKRLRATTGTKDPNKRPSMAEEYAGNIQNIYAGAGLSQPAQPPQAMPPQGSSSQVPPGGIADIPPPPQAGIASMPQAQAPQGYARGGIVTMGNYRGQGVDPRLYQILQQAATSSPYEVRLISGEREGDPRFHGKGMATDIQLYDPDTGEVLDNYQSGKYFQQYQSFANQARQAQMQMYPELADKFRWGGYFSGPKGKYGAMDLMHFDVGGVPTAGGSWETGLTPEQAQLYGINQTGGGVQVASNTPQMSIEQYIRARAPIYGIDPDVAVRVAQSEGGVTNLLRQSDVVKGGQREESYGPFQLYMQGGLGNRALAAGVDPRTTEGAWKGIDFALAEAGQKGWGQWYGAKRVGIDPMQGITGQGSQTPVYDQAVAMAQQNPTATAAAGTAAASNTVATQAADTAGKMASAENALGGDPMSQYFLMQQLLGAGQQQPAPAPASATTGPIAKPVDARQFMQNPGFMQRRRAYGLA
jgi:hypothetical protein